MDRRPGYFELGQVGDCKLLVHWSLPAGGVLVAAFVRAGPERWLYFCLAYFLLIAIHEAGHVLAAVALRLKVFTVEISGFGGLCRVEMPRRVRDSVLVYTAGLLAQAIVFLATLVFLTTFESSGAPFVSAMTFTFTYVNFLLFAVNLIPLRDSRSGLATDGAVLWRLFLHVTAGRPHPHPPPTVTPTDQSPIFPLETKLLELPGFAPGGFVHGIEIFNDRTTPMEFVVGVLTTHLGLTDTEAIMKMLEIHNKGGALIARPSEEEARRIAEAMSAEARAAGHSLVCRYAGACVQAD